MKTNKGMYFVAALVFAMFLTAAAGHAQLYSTGNTLYGNDQDFQVISSTYDGTNTITTYSNGVQIIQPGQAVQTVMSGYGDENYATLYNEAPAVTYGDGDENTVAYADEEYASTYTDDSAAYSSEEANEVYTPAYTGEWSETHWTDTSDSE